MCVLRIEERRGGEGEKEDYFEESRHTPDTHQTKVQQLTS
jgi:hypothetical protein